MASDNRPVMKASAKRKNDGKDAERIPLFAVWASRTGKGYDVSFEKGVKGIEMDDGTFVTAQEFFLNLTDFRELNRKDGSNQSQQQAESQRTQPGNGTPAASTSGKDDFPF